MNPYFERTALDARYFERHLAGRMPHDVLDVHSHMNLPEHVAQVPKERIASDWALQAGHQMSAEDAAHYVQALFPGRDYRFAAFPFPIAEADLEANNDYISRCVQGGSIEFGLMATRPEWPAEYVEGALRCGGFAGIKPYPDLISSGKGAEMSIFDFLPPEHFHLAERLGKCVLLHLPRRGRLADPDNIRELREIATRYPALKLVIAHLGRCFNPRYFLDAQRQLGQDIHHFWFDTAAVMNPDVLHPAFADLRKERLMFGLDLPIFLWHGRRAWTEDSYINLCREPLPWKREVDSPAVQDEYIFFVYEQIKNILDATQACGYGDADVRGFFAGNARALLGGCAQTK